MADNNVLFPNQTAQSKLSKSITSPVDHPEALNIFTSFLDDGFQNVFHNTTVFPFFLLERRFRTAQKEGEPIVHSLTHGNTEVIFRTASIQDKKGEYQSYFPSYLASEVFTAILELVSEQKIQMRHIEDGGIVIRFTKQDIRNHLKEQGKAKNGSQINLALEILMLAKIQIKQTDNENNLELNRAASYLQDAATLTDTKNDESGVIVAKIHPMIAADIYRGFYRQISKKYLSGHGKAIAIYNSLIMLMRHNFLQAPVEDNSPYRCKIYLSEIYFSAGYSNSEQDNDSTGNNEPTVRKIINNLRSLLMNSEVILNPADLQYEFASNMNDESDVLITLKTSPNWGRDQRRSNAIFNKIQSKISTLTS